MKKIGKYITIAFLLVVGATFSTQINAALDWLLALDFVAIGNTISAFAGKVVDLVVAVYNWVVGLFSNTPMEIVETMEPATEVVQ